MIEDALIDNNGVENEWIDNNGVENEWIDKDIYSVDINKVEMDNFNSVDIDNINNTNNINNVDVHKYINNNSVEIDNINNVDFNSVDINKVDMKMDNREYDIKYNNNIDTNNNRNNSIYNNSNILLDNNRNINDTNNINNINISTFNNINNINTDNINTFNNNISTFNNNIINNYTNTYSSSSTINNINRDDINNTNINNINSTNTLNNINNNTNNNHSTSSTSNTNNTNTNNINTNINNNLNTSSISNIIDNISSTLTPNTITKILSLTLKNFQTFKNTTITFSPTLNFIIGPNGSGKSTISNALCLLFGGTPKTIGKSKQIKEYIKFGEHLSKIELKIKIGNEFTIDNNFYYKKIENEFLIDNNFYYIKIGRGFTIANNFYYINDTIVKKTEYQNFIKNIKIDVTNLCQYLPQERVSEFCLMTNNELLYNTLSCLNKQYLINKLIKIQDLENKINLNLTKQQTLNLKKNNLKNSKIKMSKEIEKIKIKTQKQLNLDKIKSKLIWIEYDEIVNDYKRINNSIKIFNKNFNDNLLEISDIENQINVIENNPFNLELQEFLKELNSLDNQINEFLNKFKFNLNEIELLEIENELVNKKKVDRENEVCKLRNEVSDYRREVENIKSKICCDREYFNDDVFEGGGMYKRSDGRSDGMYSGRRCDGRNIDGSRSDMLDGRCDGRMDKRNERMYSGRRCDGRMDKRSDIYDSNRMDTLDNNRMYNTNDNNISIHDNNTNIDDNTLNLDFIYQTSNIDNLFIQYDNTALDELQDELFRNKKSTDQIKQTCFDIKRQVDILEEENRKIMEYKERRMEQLKRYSYDTYRAVMWLRENREKSLCDGKSVKDGNNIDSKDSNIDSNCNIKDSKDIKDIYVDNVINIKDSNIISKDIKDTKNTLKDTKNINDIKDTKNIKDTNKFHYIKFKDEIIEPPFLNINIKNENYINEVEIFLNYHVLTSFICKNSEDFELFSKIMKDEKSLSINVVEAIRKVPSPSHTPEEIKSYGFDGVILDYIDARNEIKDLLCVSCHVHDVPVLRSGGDVNRLDGGSKNRLDGDNVNRLDGGSKNGNVNRLDVDNVNRLDGGNDGEEKFKRMAISNNRDKKYINSSGMDNNNSINGIDNKKKYISSNINSNGIDSNINNNEIDNKNNINTFSINSNLITNNNTISNINNNTTNNKSTNATTKINNNTTSNINIPTTNNNPNRNINSTSNNKSTYTFSNINIPTTNNKSTNTTTKINEKQIFENTKFKRMAINGKYIEIKRSKYNKNDYVISSNIIKPKNIFTSKQDIKEINTKLEKYNNQRKKYNDNLIKLLNENKIIKTKLTKIHEKKTEFNTKISEIKNRLNIYRITIDTIRNKNIQIKKYEESIDIKIKEKQIKNTIFNLKNEKIKIKKELINLLKNKDYLNLYKKSILIYKNIKNDYKKLQLLMSSKTNLINQNVIINQSINEHEKIKNNLKPKIQEKKDLLKNKVYSKQEMEDLPNDVDELNLLIRTEVAQLKFINVDEDIQNEMDVVEKELDDVEKELSELECCKSDDDKIVNEIRSEVCENVEEIVGCIGVKFGELFSKIGEKCDLGVGEFYEGSGNGSKDGCDYIDGNECNENIPINGCNENICRNKYVNECNENRPVDGCNENIFINSENCTLDQNNCENNSNIKSTNCNKSINTINSKSTNTINKSNKKNTRCEGKLQFEYKNLPCKQWKLNILVKFRENEKLEKLNSFRQSGGEKSVSIILFLLSLQSIDNSPFRLVDEINQGMDKYNEKKVLDILFDMCERETRTQFFIISPKLVEGLCYSKGMKCIILMSDQSEDVKRAYLNG